MKEKEPKQENKYIKFIKDLSKSKRGRAVLFFVFYFIFFFVLISLIRSNYNTNRETTDNNTNNVSTEYKLDGIINGNYHFVREENINGVVSNFTGDKADNRIEGIMTRDNTFYNYFIYDNINLIKISDKYEVTTDLYQFNNITDDNNISKFLRRATLISKTEYETGNISYNYEITTNTIDEILNGTNIDIDDIPNSITLETNEDDEVVKIIYNLSSYSSYINGVPSNSSITITYSDFGEIEPLEIPES